MRLHGTTLTTGLFMTGLATLAMFPIVLMAQIVPPLPSQTGSVTGVVRTASGAPASGVRVTAVRADSTDDALRAMASLTQTDSMGRYRLENVPPGRYYIAAGRVDQPTYYPGTLDMTKGAAISISSAITVPDIDFVIQNASAMLPPALGLRGRGGPITLPLARNNVLNLIPILPGANALGAGQRRGPVTSNPTPAVPGAAARFRPSEAFGPVNQRHSDWCGMVDQRRFGSATWSDG